MFGYDQHLFSQIIIWIWCIYIYIYIYIHILYVEQTLSMHESIHDTFKTASLYTKSCQNTFPGWYCDNVLPVFSGTQGIFALCFGFLLWVTWSMATYVATFTSPLLTLAWSPCSNQASLPHWHWHLGGEVWYMFDTHTGLSENRGYKQMTLYLHYIIKYGNGFLIPMDRWIPQKNGSLIQ